MEERVFAYKHTLQNELHIVYTIWLMLLKANTDNYEELIQCLFSYFSLAYECVFPLINNLVYQAYIYWFSYESFCEPT